METWSDVNGSIVPSLYVIEYLSTSNGSKNALVIPADASNPACEDNVKDCQGTCNGTFSVDICGVCLDQNDPNRDICVDCNGTPNGPALQDDCGICHPNPSNPPNTTKSSFGGAEAPANLKILLIIPQPVPGFWLF